MTEPGPRTRTRNHVTEFLYQGDGRDCNGTPIGVVNNLPHDIFTGTSETTHDVVTANYHARIARGEIVNNPFYSVKEEHGYECTGWRVDRSTPCGSGTNWLTGNGFQGLGADKQKYLVSPSSDVTSALRSEIANLSQLVQTRALANVVPADVQGLVDVAEMGKTARLVMNPVRAIEAEFRRIKRSKSFKRWYNTKKWRLSQKSNPEKALSLFQFLSDNWLAYRYGIMPLVLSAQGAVDIVRKPKLTPRYTARASGFTSQHVSEKTTIINALYYDNTLLQTTTASGKCRAGILYEHTFELVERSGLTVHEIPSTAWELIPFSFVADWFVNTGQWIRAVTPKAGVNVLASWKSWETTIERRCDVQAAHNGLYGLASSLDPNGSFYRDTITKSREPGVNAYLTHKLPTITFQQPKDWIHLGDAFALITSTLGYK